MENIQELKIHYCWESGDEENLKTLKPFAEKYQGQFIEELYSYLANFKDMNTYLPNEKIQATHKEKLRNWFLSLFSGKYDSAYLRKLYKIGEIHVKIGLPPHYVSSTMNFVRRFFHENVRQEMGPTQEGDTLLKSVNKILDLNLDVMTSAYREEELKLYLASGKFQKTLIEWIRRASYGFDVFITITFLLVGFFLVTWIGYEAYMVVTGALAPERGGLSILGSTLILYATSELLSEELKHIRGARLSLSAFLGLALAAVIRKVLILSLSPEKTNELLVIAFLLLSLGLVYWLSMKVEAQRK